MRRTAFFRRAKFTPMLVVIIAHLFVAHVDPGQQIIHGEFHIFDFSLLPDLEFLHVLVVVIFQCVLIHFRLRYIGLK